MVSLYFPQKRKKITYFLIWKHLNLLHTWMQKSKYKLLIRISHKTLGISNCSFQSYADVV